MQPLQARRLPQLMLESPWPTGLLHDQAASLFAGYARIPAPIAGLLIPQLLLRLVHDSMRAVTYLLL